MFLSVESDTVTFHFMNYKCWARRGGGPKGDPSPLTVRTPLRIATYPGLRSSKPDVNFLFSHVLPDFLHFLSLDLLALVLESLVERLAGLDHLLELLPVLHKDLLVVIHRCSLLLFLFLTT